MFAVTGITGKVGGETARRLLASGKSVRAVVRDRAKAKVWADRGCDVVVGDITDANAMAEAFQGAQGVFLLVPPNFDPRPGFPEVRAIAAALKAALMKAKPARVVLISTIGAQARETNLLSQLGFLERELSSLPLALAFLRAAWFLENVSGDIDAVQTKHSFLSFLQPIHQAFPMVATEDIGSVAAELLQENWAGLRVVELEGPNRVSPSDIAAGISGILQIPVAVGAPLRAEWESIFRKQGMANPEPRMRMLDGFNEGWIAFEGAPSVIRKGQISLDQVLRSLHAQRTGAEPRKLG